jgi:thiamine biosynthesis lipoprotein
LASVGKSRRRFLTIVAATSTVGLTGAIGVLAGRSTAPDRSLYHWQGSALGADASLLVHHTDSGEARRLIALARTEIDRLERIFSLHLPDSALARLNRQGWLDEPPVELVRLLERAREWSVTSDGAFDVTVQPLWSLYRDHFAQADPDPDGPSANAVARALRLIDYQALEISDHRISFQRPGMAVTLNGIAQGAITDYVADLLSSNGLQNSLIELGEMRALGGHPEGRPWRVGVRDPYDGAALVAQIDLTDRAMATSSVTGTVFDASGRQHHLFDPMSGRPSRGLISASVIARRAADADAFSTALLAAREPLSFEPSVRMGVDRVLTIDAEGTVRDWNTNA